MRNNLPNFLIVGAAKCGTSSLHNYLNQHPDVFMPSYNKQGIKVKEPRFLIKDLVKNRLRNGVWDLKSYQALFNNVVNEKAIGEYKEDLLCPKCYSNSLTCKCRLYNAKIAKKLLNDQIYIYEDLEYFNDYINIFDDKKLFTNAGFAHRTRLTQRIIIGNTDIVAV